MNEGATSPTGAPPAPNGLIGPEAEAVLRLIRTRRSYPHVLPDEPPRAVIDALLEAANQAPNHHLTQPWRFFVLRGPVRRRLGEIVAEEGLKRYPAPNGAAAEQRRRQVPASFERAPIVIAVAAAPPGLPNIPPWEELAATAAAMQSILLGAHAMGLAAYWRSNGTGLEGVKTFLGLDPDAQVVGFIYIGYPDATATLVDKPRRPHHEFVRWIGWDDAPAAPPASGAAP
jgi:nitroreductase